MTQAFICGYVRTPFGRYGGALTAVRADDLAAVPIKALMERHPGVGWDAVDEVILGCAPPCRPGQRLVSNGGRAQGAKRR